MTRSSERRVAIDTCVILNVLIGGDPDHEHRLPMGRAVLDRAHAGDYRLVIPANVIAETAGSPRVRGSDLAPDARAGRLEKFWRWVDNRALLVVEIDHRTAIKAAKLGEERQLKGGDAMVLAASLVAGCEVLYSWDTDLLKCDGVEGMKVRPPDNPTDAQTALTY